MDKLFKLDQTPQLKRNAFLTILLLLIFTANLLVGGSFLLNLLQLAGGAEISTPLWLIVFSELISIGNIICVLAVWFWRKWGAIFYGTLVVTAYIVQGVALHDFRNFYALVGAIILAILIFPYWKFMK